MILRTVLPAALVGLLAAAPAGALAGNPYCGTCGYGTTQSYAPTYTSGPIYYPPGYYPGTYSYSSYAPTDYTFFRPGQDLINARLAQEAATAAVDKLKAELAAREAAAAQAAKDQADAAFKQQTLAALQALAAGQQRVAVTAPAPADPRTAQLEADNAALKETLKKLLDQKARTPAPAGPGPDAPPPVPPIPKADASPPVPQPPQPPVAQGPPGKGDANVLAAVQTFFNANCTRCHGDASAPRMNLAHAERLTYEDLSDCIARMASPVKELAMPKDKPGSVTGEQAYPVQLLQATAPRRQR